MDELTFSNPRTYAELDWPAANARTVARFCVVPFSDLEQVSRQTGTGKERFSPVCDVCRIVDGSDGKTYILGIVTSRLCYIMEGTMRKLKYIPQGHKPFTQIVSLLNRTLKCDKGGVLVDFQQ